MLHVPPAKDGENAAPGGSKFPPPGVCVPAPIRPSFPVVPTSASAFAVVSFIVGLTFTLSGGAAIDIAYHLAMLPVLVGTTVLLVRSRSRRQRT
jgi:hypothetical protein